MEMLYPKAQKALWLATAVILLLAPQTGLTIDAGGLNSCSRELPDGRWINEPCVVHRPIIPPIVIKPKKIETESKKKPDPVADLVRQATSFANQKQWYKAWDAIEAALKHRPGDQGLLALRNRYRGMARGALGERSFRAGKYKEAVETYVLALKDLPGNQEILRGLANAKEKLDKIEASIKEMERHRRHNRNLQLAKKNIINRIDSINRVMQGRSSTLGNTPLNLSGTNADHGAIGSDDIFKSKSEKAESVTQKVFEQSAGEEQKKPGHIAAIRQRAKASAAFSMAMHLSGNGRFKQAIDFLHQALEADPQCQNCIEELARHMKLVNDHLQRERVLKAIYDHKANLFSRLEPSWHNQADYLLDALEYGVGDWHASLSYLETGVEAEPDNLPLRNALEYLKGLHGGIQASSAVKARPNPLGKQNAAVAAKALAKTASGKHAAAAEIYRSARQGRQGERGFNGARAYAEQCQPLGEEASADSGGGKPAVNLSDQEIERIALWAIGYAKMVEGDDKTALEYLKIAQEIDPSDPGTGQLLAFARGDKPPRTGRKEAQPKTEGDKDDKQAEFLSQERAAVAFYALGHYKFFLEQNKKAAVYYLKHAQKYQPGNRAIENLLTHAAQNQP
jgi:hypothetical protein